MTVSSNTGASTFAMDDDCLERDHDNDGHGTSIADLVRRCEELADQNNLLREEMADRNSSFQERLALLETAGLPQDFPSRIKQSDWLITNQEKTSNELFSTVDADEAVADCGIDKRVTLLEQRLDDLDDKKEERDDYMKCSLQESTFTFFITESPFSAPFGYALFSVALSMTCLGLTLGYASTKGSSGNPLGIPANVHIIVTAAQFLGLLVGVLMEDEVPQGLQLIANGLGHSLLYEGRRVNGRVIVSSILRLLVGYMFLATLFISVAQNDDVIEIFFDVLALEFVENIDDVLFRLAKRGFFGQTLLFATIVDSLEVKGNTTIARQTKRGRVKRSSSFSSSGLTGRTWSSILVRVVYFVNAIVLLGGMAYIARCQDKGYYRCELINIQMNEEIFEDAYIHTENGLEKRLLVYSAFNGVYREVGSYGGYPKFVEQNKNDGQSFVAEKRGAEIIYCKDVNAWVLRHEQVYLSSGEDSNDCAWLWMSESDSYNILELSNNSWDVWLGGEVKQSQMAITCAGCISSETCSNQGRCVNGRCECRDGYYGMMCEYGPPCPYLATEKANKFDSNGAAIWQQTNPIKLLTDDEGKYQLVHNRPVYIQEDLSGIPYDLRLHKILEKDVSFAPSVNPSLQPSASQIPSLNPTDRPSTRLPTYSPTTPPPSISPNTSSDAPTPFSTPFSTPSVGTEQTLSPTEEIYRPVPPPSPEFAFDDIMTPEPTDRPVETDHTQLEYDLNPDFADYDDFFERESYHELNLTEYSVVIAYAGSRWYGTIIDPGEDVEKILYSGDFHSFWDGGYNPSRTFMISDSNYDGSPVGVDFYEMRRRSNLLNSDVDFAYGPFGALIPIMKYKDSGFFHCTDGVTEQPTSAPTSTQNPTTFPSSGPSETCSWIEIKVVYDCCAYLVSWFIEDMPGNEVAYRSVDNFDAKTDRHAVCLPRGSYRFRMNGSSFVRRYRVSSGGMLIEKNQEDVIFFGLPYSQAPSEQPTSSSVPSITLRPTARPTVSHLPTKSSEPTKSPLDSTPFPTFPT